MKTKTEQDPETMLGCVPGLIVALLFIVLFISCTVDRRISRIWIHTENRKLFNLVDGYYTVKENMGNGNDLENKRQLDSLTKIIIKTNNR